MSIRTCWSARLHTHSRYVLIHLPSGGFTHICHPAMRLLAAHYILNDATQSVKTQTHNSLGQAEAHTHTFWMGLGQARVVLECTLHTDLTGVALTQNTIFHHFSSRSLYPHPLFWDRGCVSLHFYTYNCELPSAFPLMKPPWTFWSSLNFDEGGEIIWTDPWPLDFDWGSELTQYVT